MRSMQRGACRRLFVFGKIDVDAIFGPAADAGGLRFDRLRGFVALVA